MFQLLVLLDIANVLRILFPVKEPHLLRLVKEVKVLYKIPLTNSPNQTFRVTVPVNNENKTFTIKLNYNDQAKYWNFSLYDTFAEQPI